MIRFEHVTRRYESGGRPALDDVSVEFLRGDFVYLIGASGSGKSTLLRMILREGLPQQGKITVAGQNLGLMLERRVPAFRRSVGMVFQDFRLLPEKTVFDNVAFAMRVIGARRSQVRKRVGAVLERVDLAHLAKRYPHEISGGEQQRAAIARAIVNEPAILLADEPTGNLDPRASAEVMKILRWINAGGTTVVMATHDRTIVDGMRRRVVQLHRGSLIRDDAKGGYDAPSGSDAWRILREDEQAHRAGPGTAEAAGEVGVLSVSEPAEHESADHESADHESADHESAGHESAWSESAGSGSGGPESAESEARVPQELAGDERVSPDGMPVDAPAAELPDHELMLDDEDDPAEDAEILLAADGSADVSDAEVSDTDVSESTEDDAPDAAQDDVEDDEGIRVVWPGRGTAEQEADEPLLQPSGGFDGTELPDFDGDGYIDEEPEDDPSEEPISGPAGGPAQAETPDDTAGPGMDPAEELAEDPADEFPEGPADGLTGDPADELATEPADELATEPSDEPADRPSGDSGRIVADPFGDDHLDIPDEDPFADQDGAASERPASAEDSPMESAQTPDVPDAVPSGTDPGHPADRAPERRSIFRRRRSNG